MFNAQFLIKRVHYQCNSKAILAGPHLTGCLNNKKWNNQNWEIPCSNSCQLLGWIGWIISIPNITADVEPEQDTRAEVIMLFTLVILFTCSQVFSDCFLNIISNELLKIENTQHISLDPQKNIYLQSWIIQSWPACWKLIDPSQDMSEI